MASYWLKIVNFSFFPTPALVDASAQGIPSEFLDETYRAKTRGRMGLLYGENCMMRNSMP